MPVKPRGVLALGAVLIASATVIGARVESPTTPAVLAASPVAQASPASQPADFNGDGFSDLAVGVPLEKVGDDFEAGAVNVLYGSAAGLMAAGSQFWHQDSPGVEGDGAESGDEFGRAVASGDFDGDGFSDLAVGVHSEGLGDVFRPGAVNVLYGSPAGLAAVRSQFWHQDVLGVDGRAEEEDEFGASLASADFNGDGFEDLAVGVPSEGVGKSFGAGSVNVLYGSASGITATGDQVWHQDSPGVDGAAERFDNFGFSLAAADFGKSSQADLVVGVPFENFSRLVSAGSVNVLYGSASGITATGDQVWHQDSPAVNGAAETDDEFGFSLAAADFGKSSQADLVVGVPFESFSHIFSAGSVNVLYGSASGITATDDQVWHQNSPGLEDTAEDADLFGFSVVTADFGNSSQADLAVGVNQEGLGDVDAAGAASVLYGTPSGLSSTANQFWHQDSPEVEDVAESEDGFGYSLAAANFGKSPQADLALSASEDVGDAIFAGAVNVLYGTDAGLSATDDQFWHQDVPGVEGDGAETGDGFGLSLAPKQ